MLKKIIRVFPKRTTHTPTDKYSYCGTPDFFVPEHDEVHISVCFTWDIQLAVFLKHQWDGFTDKPVRIGGPACGDPGNGFEPGKYLRNGITITSRGCPYNCSYCLVPKREGRLRELRISPGNVIQDNNLLACSRGHIKKVFEMLKKQKNIMFTGGIHARLVRPKIVEEMRSLKISALFMSCDTPGAIFPLEKAVKLFKKAGFTRAKIRVYVLIGKNMAEEENRMANIFHIGALPFAQLYQPIKKINYSPGWKKFAKLWSRPARYKAFIKNHA